MHQGGSPQLRSGRPSLGIWPLSLLSPSQLWDGAPVADDRLSQVGPGGKEGRGGKLWQSPAEKSNANSIEGLDMEFPRTEQLQICSDSTPHFPTGAVNVLLRAGFISSIAVKGERIPGSHRPLRLSRPSVGLATCALGYR